MKLIVLKVLLGIFKRQHKSSQPFSDKDLLVLCSKRLCPFEYKLQQRFMPLIHVKGIESFNAQWRISYSKKFMHCWKILCSTLSTEHSVYQQSTRFIHLKVHLVVWWQNKVGCFLRLRTSLWKLLCSGCSVTYVVDFL